TVTLNVFEPELVLPAPTIAGTDGRDRLIGTEGDDVIFGFGGDDIIHAGAGDDIIVAGPGRNQVYGGPGADLFVLHGRDSISIIYDFDAAEGDRLDIADTAFRRDGEVDLDLLTLTRQGSFHRLSGEMDGEDIPLALLRGLGDTDLETLFGRSPEMDDLLLA
ncbi:MAG: hypothetical protein EA406_00875, partial [Rhodospirillales bacterium]